MWRLLEFALLATLPLAALEVSSDSLPWAVTGQAYSTRIALNGDIRCQPEIGFVLAAGRLPDGVRLYPGGELRGVPLRGGVYEFTVLATSRCSRVYRTLELTVTGAALLLAEPREIALTPGAPAAILVRANWPDLPYSWRIADAPWLRVASGRGVTPGPGSALDADRLVLAADGEGLAPGRYEAVVTFQAWESVTQPRVRVILDVPSPEPPPVDAARGLERDAPPVRTRPVEPAP